MASFDFVAGEDFRAALESDYRELQAAVKSESWKSVHVLAGSIVEAILVDYIAGTELPKTKKIDPLKLDLGGAIKICRDEGIVSERVASLSDVVRSFRNLIHPGRVMRLGEVVDVESASLAATLVEMVAKEVGKSRVESKGLTAEQLLAKLRGDPTSQAIMSHLIADIEATEMERLLVKVLPDAYYEESQDWEGDAAFMNRLRMAFDQVFEAATPTVKKKASGRYAEVLRHEDGWIVGVWETAFFLGAMLDHMEPSDASMAKAHLLSRLKNDRSAALLRAARDLGNRVTAKEQNDLISAAVSEIAYGSDGESDQAARELLDDLYKTQDEEADERMVARLKAWVMFLDERGRADASKTVDAIRTKYEDLDELPF